MAKKKKAAAPKRKAKAATKQSRRQAESVLRRGPVRRRPADRSLPGMEDRVDAQLDQLASAVADERHTQAESKQTEAGLLQAVQKRMKALGRATFKAHGVEFVRVPGDEKLRVRLTRGGEEQGEDLREEDDPEDLEPMDAAPGVGEGDVFSDLDDGDAQTH